MKYLVTGAAGFIGMHTSLRLLKEGHEVFGIDNLNDYYDVKLKRHRLDQLKNYESFRFSKIDLADKAAIAELFDKEKFQRVIHLGAQAGVRHSLLAPFSYIDSNLTGTLTILEGCRHNPVEHLVIASSSSVYGMNPKVPFSPQDAVDHPVSLYAATKKSGEMLAHSYSHLYDIPTTMLRFFTVYGPAGRPDMAPWLFTDAILNDRPIKVFNHGEMQRDFTYIDDIVDGVVAIQDVIPVGLAAQTEDPSRSTARYVVHNIGNNRPITLDNFIAAIEKACGKKATRINMPMQPGDVKRTYADIDSFSSSTGVFPVTSIEDGMANFVEWYQGEWSERF